MADEVRRLQLVVPMALRLEIFDPYTCIVDPLLNEVSSVLIFGQSPTESQRDPQGGILELPLDPSGDASDQDEGADAWAELSFGVGFAV